MSRPRSLIGFNSICIQYIVQSYDPFKFVYVGTVYYRQNLDPGRTHAVQRRIKRLVLVNVGKSKRIHKLSYRLGSTLR